MKTRLPGLLVALAALLGCSTPLAPVDTGAADTGPPGCVDDSDCDDGVFCNGAEMCQPASDLRDGVGCVDAPEGPCAASQTCDEAADACLTDCDLAPDADGDGATAIACGGTDCDDADARRSPGIAEVCDADDIDEDCDPATFGDRDRDRDTFLDQACCNVAGDGTRACGADCDDGAAAVSPVAGEICDLRDNDCDGASDEGVTIDGFADEDGDLHGDPDAPRTACPGASRFSLVDDDCDDRNGRVHASQVEVCDGLDNDCNGEIDDRTREVTWYRDADGDRFGSAAGGTRIDCEPPDGYELLPLDCDDARAGTSPIADEQCNGRDDDCDGRADFAIAPGDTEDDDGDGHVDVACGGLGDDCDDRDEGVFPGADAYCDGRDHDCDGAIDVGAPVDWYRDEDGDGFGAGAPISSCDPPTGYVRQGGDCDDSLAGRSPIEPDDCDGVDDDCDGMTDESATRLAFYADADGDGAGGGAPLLACAQPAGHGLYPTDCDDTTTARYPGAVELCDGIDNDCDGAPDEAADTVCALPGAMASCVAGGCVVTGCVAGYASCDGSGANGCEVDTTRDVDHCGDCATECPDVAGATRTCGGTGCGFVCVAGASDCDGSAANGCESVLATDPEDCGTCGRRCASRDHAPASCTAGVCGTRCESGWTSCDALDSNGCEVHTAEDPANCGGCGVVCPASTDACVRGSCAPVPWTSDGSDGSLDVTADMVLPAGVYEYTTIRVRAGARLTTNGTGVLELRASGDVIIEGTIDLSGSPGGAGGAYSYGGGGGATGTPLAPGDAASRTVCPPLALGGTGGPGGGNTCAQGGAYGGGGGGSTYAGGGGGGGYAGGGGGDAIAGYPGFRGAEEIGVSVGGQPGLGGEPGSGVYAGGDGFRRGPGDNAGGGSIGAPATTDLAVATTFRPGSGGGGGGGEPLSGGFINGGGGGGGAGGALRITSLTRIVITTTGVLRADGGAGGAGVNPMSLTFDGAGSGGGGSGGVIYLASPELDVRGRVSAVGGPGGTGGGAGGLGRIRLSVLAERCTLFGFFSPALEAACARTPAGVAGRVYIDEYPF